jgi:hypothetical protein
MSLAQIVVDPVRQRDLSMILAATAGECLQGPQHALALRDSVELCNCLPQIVIFVARNEANSLQCGELLFGFVANRLTCW